MFVNTGERDDGLCWSGERVTIGVGGSIALRGLRGGGVGNAMSVRTRKGDDGGAGLGVEEYVVDGNDEALYLDFNASLGDEGDTGPGEYFVDGRGMQGMSSFDGEDAQGGACDIRNPICTVAEEAIEESLRCLELP